MTQAKDEPQDDSQTKPEPMQVDTLKEEKVAIPMKEETQWEPLEATTENFRSVCYEHAKEILKMYNGPGQFLNKFFPQGTQQAQEFADYLRKEFPKSDAVAYASMGGLPGNNSDHFNVHLSDLSWFPESSTKPLPYLITSLSLLDEITTNGFQTSGPWFLALGHFL